MEWSLYNNEKYLEPLVFSNQKSQLDIVKETIDAIKEGYKIIFIKGACGTGKSAIALNIAKEMGKTSIVVPVKTLQKQYKEDYTNKLKILKDNKELKITIIDGRNNHKCPYKNISCDDKELPCTIEIKNQNIEQLSQYLKENENADENKFNNIKDIRRMSIACACPYWSPILPEEINYNLKSRRLKYNGLKNKRFIIHKRKEGCSYYNQFDSYTDSDVIIFNSRKYELETVMDRKPRTEVEIIDECDEFLDSLSSEKRINLDRISRTIQKINDTELKDLKMDIENIIQKIKNSHKEEVSLIRNTYVLELLNVFINNPRLIDSSEEEISDYLFGVYEKAKYFKNFFDETYVSFYNNTYGDLTAILVTINLEKKFNEFLEKNKVFVMMSGTIHSDSVLKNIFGIKDYKIIEAETEPFGNIKVHRTGLEKEFNYRYLKENREEYLKALATSVEISKKPALIHIQSFSDLPNEFENSFNIKTSKELKEEQETWKRGELIQRFKNKETDILYSTKCNRGIDLPGDMCNSILFTKYPYPNIDSLFWKVLKKHKPDYFRLFYFDKAKREFVQRIYRGLRSKDDKIEILSPDLRVLNSFEI